MDDFRELPPQARAARVAYLLLLRGQLTNREIQEETGIRTNAGVTYIMDNISLGGVPVYKKDEGLYALLPQRRQLVLLHEGK